MSTIEILKLFLKQPNTYVIGKSFSNYSDFVTGLFINSDNELNKRFIEFLRNKHQTHFTVYWPYYILEELSNGEEEQAKQKLFILLNEFCSSL